MAGLFANRPLSRFACLHWEKFATRRGSRRRLNDTFDSVADLRQFTQERGTWLVIASEKGAPLLGYRYPRALVYTVDEGDKTFYAFALVGHPKEKPAEPVQGCAAWPIHVEYRYLPLGVGHDTEYGIGCVSVFGFAGGSDTLDLHNIRMCILCAARPITMARSYRGTDWMPSCNSAPKFYHDVPRQQQNNLFVLLAARAIFFAKI